MGARVETANGMADAIKWSFAIVLFGGAVGAFYWYVDQPLLVRVGGLLAATIVAIAIALQTEKGRAGLNVLQEARTEMRKVVWPTRKETVQTTMIVIAIVMLVAVILWLFDTLLAYLMRQFLGHGA